jgi:hypothetical protein
MQFILVDRIDEAIDVGLAPDDYKTDTSQTKTDERPIQENVLAIAGSTNR